MPVAISSLPHAPAIATVAITGLACRLPGMDVAGAADLSDAATRLRGPPAFSWADRWGTPAFGAWLDDPCAFDPTPFGISAYEAARMDPQHRLLLEAALHAVDDAGLTRADLAGSRTGVWIAMGSQDWVWRTAVRGGHVDAYSVLGNAAGQAAGRVAALFDLRGPAVVVDAGCAATLVAIDAAARAIAAGEIDRALVGAVQVVLAPDGGRMLAAMGVEAEGEVPLPFDPDSPGSVRGEGVGVFVLERLRDGDSVRASYAHLLGSAIVQAGAAVRGGVPTPEILATAMRRALADADVPPADVGWVEAHGTGAPAADEAELAAIEAVFPGVAFGSVKGVIGHLEAAAGMAGIVAALGRATPTRPIVAVNTFGMSGTVGHLVLEVGERLGIRSGWGGSGRADGRWNTTAGDGGDLPAYGSISGAKWNTTAGDGGDLPAYGSISGREGNTTAGDGGDVRPYGSIRAASVVSGPGDRVRGDTSDPTAANTSTDQPLLLGLSAATPTALHTLATRWAAALDVPGADAAARGRAAALCRAAARRITHPYRLAVTGADAPTLVAALRAADVGAGSPSVLPPPGGGTPASPRPRTSRPTVGFLFTGQGAQEPGMGRQLYASDAAFREAFDEAADAFAAHGVDVAALCFGGGDLRDTRLAQPALFALQWALAQAWAARGLVPAVVVGHSIGELAAAAVAGALTLDDAAQIVAARASAMGALPPGGSMLAVLAARDTVVPLLLDLPLDLAVENAPRQVVVAGPEDAVATLEERLEDAMIAATRLRTSHAFHSRLQEPCLPGFSAAIAHIPATTPRIPWVSTASAAPMVHAPDAAYWAGQLRGTVRFREAMVAARADVWVEIGPGDTLCRHAKAAGAQAIPSLPRGRPEPEGFAAATVTLYERGADVLPDDGGPAEPGPPYPFERRRFGPEALERAAGNAPRHVVAGAPTAAGASAVELEAAVATGPAVGARVSGEPAQPTFPATAVRSPATAAADPDPIVIVGLAVRLPGAPDLEALAATVLHPVVAIGPGPSDRAGHAGAAGWLPDAWRFDAAAFGVSRREAARLDPRQGLALELAWEALERSGLALDARATGVFLGTSGGEPRPTADDVDPQALTGRVDAAIAGRVAYTLGLEGPALCVDAACASSLVALHLAAESVRRGECAQALAGGVQILGAPLGTALVAATGALSPTGRARPFDADTDGFVRGEGGAVLVVTRLSRARARGLHVWGTLVGSAVGHGGGGGGFAAPDPVAQERVIRAALGPLDPRDVAYVEAHGTGTRLGDPVEAGALGRVYGGVALGSAKACFGHLEPAAGAVGVARLLVALATGHLPAQPSVARLHPEVARWGHHVPAAGERWPTGKLGAVSAIGMTGTIAHVVVAPPNGGPPARTPVPRAAWRVELSARSPGALRSLCDRWAEALATRPDIDVADVAWTALQRRRLPARRAVVAATVDELRAALLAEGDAPGGTLPTAAGRRVLDLPIAAWGGEAWALAHPGTGSHGDGHPGDGHPGRGLPDVGGLAAETAQLAAQGTAAQPTDATRDGTLRRLHALLADLLPAALGAPEVPLGELGLDSLGALVLAQALPDVPPATLRALGWRALAEAVGPAAEAPPRATPTALRAPSRRPALALPDVRVEQLRDGLGVPLVLFHPGGVSPDAWEALDAGDRPLWLARSWALEAGDGDTIAPFGVAFAAAIGALFPGPVVLGGWSLGGVVALEAAARREAAGHDVPLVVLLDTYGPGVTMPADLGPLARAWSAVADPHGSAPRVDLWRQGLDASARRVTGWAPPARAGDLLRVQATERHGVAVGWSHGREVWVEADHYSLVRGLGLDAVGVHLRAALARLDRHAHVH